MLHNILNIRRGSKSASDKNNPERGTSTPSSPDAKHDTKHDAKEAERRLNLALEQLSVRLETKRRHYQNILLGGLVLLVTGLIVIAYPFDFAGEGGLMLSVVIALIPALILYHVLNYFYRKKAKRLFIDALVESTGLKYSKHGLFPVAEIARHKIIPPHHSEHREDGFEGRYRDIGVALQEVRLVDIEKMPRQAGRARHKPRTREHTVFWGLLVRLSVKKPMGAHTVVMPSSALQTFLRTRFSDFAPVKLVSTKFSKKYDVMSTDQIEARVILDPAFMERFMEARKILRAKWAEVSFLEDEILFAVQRFRPLFETGALWRPVRSDYLKRSAEELLIIFKMIDILKLNPQVPT